MADAGSQLAPTDILLRERARALALPRSAGAVEAGALELLEFRLARERYALETRHVSTVVPLRELTPVPCAPRFILGIVNVRGRITPVLDIRVFFDLPGQGLTDLHRVILLRGQELEFGLLADAITGVQSVHPSGLQPSLPTLTGIRSEYLKGVTADRVVVLDVDRLLADPGIIVHEEVDN
jgi:purine-binding chemotaxis protein CheW